MSSGSKRPLEECLGAAERFRLLFDGHFISWSVAGSVRRRKSMVGDIEHVVVPKPSLLEYMDSLIPGSLFGAGDKPLSKAVKSDGKTRWGEKYRAAVHLGFDHEVFFAEPGNFGAIMAIRTGPDSFSKHCVTRALSRGMRHIDGWLTYRSGEKIVTKQEADWFRMLGMDWVEPEDREAFVEALRAE